MNWPTVPLRRLTECLDGRRFPLNREQRSNLPGDVPYWGAGGVLDFVESAIFDEPLLLLGEDGAPFFTPGKDVAYFVEGPTWVNNHIHALRPTAGDGRFLTYALNSVDYANYITGTTRDKLTQDDLKQIEVPCPPLREQRRIADFLDAETTRIDHLLKLRSRQIDLHDEAAFSRVYDAVRGTHVAGERKDSGLSWLGSIPASWRVGAVSHYFEVELGKMLNQERAHGDHLRPYLRVANVQWDRIDISDLAMMDFPTEEQSRYRLKPGDLLVNEGGSWPGRAAVWNGDIHEIYYQKALHRIRSRGTESPRWLYYCLVVAERLRVFQVQGNTSTMTHLTREQLRPQRFPFPYIDVQRRAVERLDRAKTRDSVIRRLLNRQRSLLAERRQALITAAVSGQFDVSTASGRNVTDGVSA
ncbi:restriction endonuclease subunit S [Streptomyces brevispora]|uniref:restriction endonuclease subunit S n=1 Tax=Streptomyces brevispora TaxID=887462 RepID=UPI0033BFD90A